MEPEVLQIIESHKAITIAYNDADGIGACAVWYAFDRSNNKLYFFSSMTSRHGLVFATPQPIAFTIHRDNQQWDQIKGIQGKGTARPASDRKQGFTILRNRFKFLDDGFEDIDEAMEKVDVYEIRISWIRLIDNTKGFSFRQEFNF